MHTHLDIIIRFILYSFSHITLLVRHELFFFFFTISLFLFEGHSLIAR